MRKLRNQRGWTQEQHAGALQRAGLDISRSALAKVEARMTCVGDHELLFYMKTFRVEFEDLYPPIDPHGADLYDDVKRLMTSRF